MLVNVDLNYGIIRVWLKYVTAHTSVDIIESLSLPMRFSR